MASVSMKEFFGGAPVKVVQSASSSQIPPVSIPSKAQRKDMFESTVTEKPYQQPFIGGDMGSYAKGFGEILSQGNQRIKEAKTPGEGISRELATGGELIGHALSLHPVVAAFTGVANKVREVGTEAIDNISKALVDKLSPDQKDHLKTVVSKVLQPVADFANKDPETAKRVQEEFRDAFSLLNYLLPEGSKKGTSLALDEASAAKNAAAEKVGAAVQASAEKVGAPFKSSYKPEVAELFKSEDIVPPVSAVTDSPFIQSMEAKTSKTVAGQKITENFNKAKTALEAKTNAVIDSLKPEKTISDENLGKTLQEGLGSYTKDFEKTIKHVADNARPEGRLSKQDIGKQIQEGLREFEIKFKDTQEKIYSDFERTYGRVKERPANTEAMLAEIINDQSQDYYKGVDPRLRATFEKISGETSEIKSARAEGMPENVIESMRQRPELTFDELKSTRTSVGEQLSRDPENTALKRLYGALSQDMQSAVERHDPTAGEKLTGMSSDYAVGKAKIESRLASSIEQSNPENIAESLLGRNSSDTLKVLRGQIGEKRFKLLGDEFVHQILDESINDSGFSLEKFKSKLENYDAETLKELLDPSQRSNLNETAVSLNRLQTQFIEGKGKIGSTLSGNPERVAQNLIQRNSAEALREVRKMVGPEKFSEVTKTFTRQLFDNAELRGKFDLGKLKESLAKYDPATLAEIFDKPQREALDDAIAQLEKLEVLKDAMKPGERILGGSQTAYLLNAAKTGSVSTALATAIFTGHPFIAAGLLAELAKDYVGAKLFTTETGRKFLTEGLLNGQKK